MNKKEYEKLDLRNHILKKPGMYIGNINPIMDDMYIWNQQQQKIVSKNILYSPGLYKIYDEILVNAIDETTRINKKYPLTLLDINIQSDNITIINDGPGIEVKIHPKYKIYIPELIFGNLLTSSNYDEDEKRITGGTHGLGAKLTAIYSKKFIIHIDDPINQLSYYQVFENNLAKINKPIIKKLDKGTTIGKVSIQFYPDFKKFGQEEEYFSYDLIALLKKRVYDTAWYLSNSNYIENSNNIKVILNGEIINEKIVEDEFNYIKLYNFFNSENKDYILYTANNKCQGFSFIITLNRPSDSSESNRQNIISFVNGINTFKNGKHVDYIIDKILNVIKKQIPENMVGKANTNIKSSINLFLKSTIINPNFSSQTKEELITPPNKFGFECEFPANIINELKTDKIGLIKFLKQKAVLISQLSLTKIEGKKSSKIKSLPKLEDANYAGTKKSSECTLILTEGDSAKATALAGLGGNPMGKNGRNFFGVFPLKGKLLNVRDISTKIVTNNEEITNIIKILGLKMGKVYNRENIGELRYGNILLMMDADEDGSHIKGLVLNFLNYFFPSLLKIDNFIQVLITPVIKLISKNKEFESLSFYTLTNYNQWKSKNKEMLSNYRIKYYKGLGTSTREEAIDYFTKLESNIIYINDNTKELTNKHPDLELAFSKHFIEKRKEWLSDSRKIKLLEYKPPEEISINSFINEEMIHFSNYDNVRSIPSIVDGFKPSNRKVFFGISKKNLGNNEEIKVAQLSAYVAEVSAYHHGEVSLTGTIINMAQNFIGSNNVNLLEPIGQLGTRLLGGKDHSSARYIFTKLSEIAKKIFIKEDNNILNYLDDDGFKIEPEVYFPIVPILLLNGALGIGTGFSTYLPNYRLEDIVLYLKNKIEGRESVKLVPHYNNFTGKIVKFDMNTYVSMGLYKLDEKEIVITELPVKLWTTEYKEFLEDLIYSRDSYFTSYKNLSDDVTINFVLKIRDNNSYLSLKKLEETESGPKGLNNLLKYLKLIKTLKVSNLYFFNSENKLMKYKNVYQIIDEFYEYRLTIYQKRKKFILNQMENEIEKNKSLIKWLVNILPIDSNNKPVKPKINIYNMEQEEIIKYLEKNNYYMMEPNKYGYLLNLSLFQINIKYLQNVKKTLNELNNKYQSYKSKSVKSIWLEELSNIN